MELIAPWNKESLFLTLTTYNSSDEPVLASAEVVKDQPFFKTAGGGVYIACESFRLSAFASDLGYIYQNIRPNWFISGQHREKAQVQESIVESSVAAQSVLLENETTGKNEMRLVMLQTPEFQNDNSIQRHMDQYAKDLNDFRIHENGEVEISPTISGATETRRFHLLEDPAEKLVGPGLGENGLTEIQIEILPNWDPAQLDSQILTDISTVTGKHFPTNWVMGLNVYKNTLPPNVTFEDLKVFFSRGLYIYNDKASNNYDYHLNGEPIFRILGPRHITIDNAGDLSTGNTRQPRARLFTDNDQYFKSGVIVNFDAAADGVPGWTANDPKSGRVNGDYGVPTQEEAEARHQDIEANEFWYDEDTHSYQFMMTVEFASAATRLRVEQIIIQAQTEYPDIYIDEFFGLNVFGAERFFVYNDSRPLHQCMHSSFAVNQLTGTPLDDAFPATLVSLVEENQVNSKEVIGRSFEKKDYPTISPNQMFQIFNAKDDTGENGWLLNGHANGGFQIEIKKDYDVFVIQKEFADLLGLDPRMISFQNSAIAQAEEQNRILVIPCEEPDFEGNSKAKYTNENFSNYVTEGDIEQFTLYDPPQMLNPATIKNLIGETLQKTNAPENESFFKLVNTYNKTLSRERITRFRKDPFVETTKDGEVYIFHNVKAGDYMENLQMVSMESFALFEGIQLCVPSLPFQPMITSFSSGSRVLAELRLDFPVGPQAGPDGTNQGTNDFWVGDIHWSANNGHQYLQLSTAQQSIYNMNIRAYLVYRDANNIPPKPIWIAPKGGLFQVKIRLVSVK